MRYNILLPDYTPHHENGMRVRIDQAGAWLVSWKVFGQCNSMAHAKELGFSYCVLEKVK